MMVRVVLKRVTNAARIFERSPLGIVGFFWRGKHSTDPGSVHVEVRAPVDLG